MSLRRRVEFNHAISGTTIVLNPVGTFGDPDQLRQSGVAGRVHGAIIRWEQTSGGGTLSALRVKAQSRRHGTAITAATVVAEALLYDSGSFVPASSATAAAQTDAFDGAAGDSQDFIDGFDSLAEVALTGTVGGTLSIVYDVETYD